MLGVKLMCKDGKCDDANHYRPISVLPVTSNIVEKLCMINCTDLVRKILIIWFQTWLHNIMTYVTDLQLMEMKEYYDISCFFNKHIKVLI